jgi:hypothetical protein
MKLKRMDRRPQKAQKYADADNNGATGGEEVVQNNKKTARRSKSRGCCRY